MSSLYLYPSASYAPLFRGAPSNSASFPWAHDDYGYVSSSSPASLAIDPIGYAIRNAHIEAEARNVALTQARARARARAQAEAEAEAHRQYLYQRQQERERQRLARIRAEETLRLQRAKEARLAGAIARHLAQAHYEAERDEKIRRIAAQQQHRLALELEHQRRVEAAKRSVAQQHAQKTTSPEPRAALRHQLPSLEELILPPGFQQFLAPFLGSLIDTDSEEASVSATQKNNCISDKKASATAATEDQAATPTANDIQSEVKSTATATAEAEPVVVQPESSATSTKAAPSPQGKSAPTSKGKGKASPNDSDSDSPPSFNNVEDILPNVLQHFLGPFFGNLMQAQGSEQAGSSSLKRCPVFKKAESQAKRTDTNVPTAPILPSEQASKASEPTEAQPRDDQEQIESETKSESKTKATSPTRSVPVGSVPIVTPTTSEPIKAAASGSRNPSPAPSAKSHHSSGTDDSRGRSRSPKRARVSDVDENGNEVEKDEEEGSWTHA